jgi:hypothetical protein
MRGIQDGAEGARFPIQARSEEHCRRVGPLALFQGLGCGTRSIRNLVGFGWRRGRLLDEGEIYIERTFRRYKSRNSLFLYLNWSNVPLCRNLLTFSLAPADYPKVLLKPDTSP